MMFCSGCGVKRLSWAWVPIFSTISSQALWPTRTLRSHRSLKLQRSLKSSRLDLNPGSGSRIGERNVENTKVNFTKPRPQQPTGGYVSRALPGHSSPQTVSRCIVTAAALMLTSHIHSSLPVAMPAKPCRVANHFRLYPDVLLQRQQPTGGYVSRALLGHSSPQTVSRCIVTAAALMLTSHIHSSLPVAMPAKPCRVANHLRLYPDPRPQQPTGGYASRALPGHSSPQTVSRCIVTAAGLMLTSHVHSSPPVATPLEPCRVAPYVNVPRLPSLPFPPPATFSAFDPALLTAAHQYAAAAAALAGPGTSPLLLCHPQYSLALAALHHDRLHSKNSSIADLRLKAKKHAEALELDREKESV
ncbi:Short stature homeobox protein 2 [Homalodisca vitripennis]|nr:Short stature homeobox protein 2 [Homalodisca vitripennis]